MLCAELALTSFSSKASLVGLDQFRDKYTNKSTEIMCKLLLQRLPTVGVI